MAQECGSKTFSTGILQSSLNRRAGQHPEVILQSSLLNREFNLSPWSAQQVLQLDAEGRTKVA